MCYLRLRKEKFFTTVYLRGMDAQIFHARSMVEDVLRKWPQTFSVFRRHNTDCIGCLLQRFCSLQDVAETYEIELQDLTKDLEMCIEENNKT